MSTEILVVNNDKIEEASTRARARGATDVKVEAIPPPPEGKSKLTFTFPPLDEEDEG